MEGLLLELEGSVYIDDPVDENFSHILCDILIDGTVVFFLSHKIKGYLKREHVFDNVLLVLIDGIRELDLWLLDGFDGFDVGDELEIKRVMFILGFIIFICK